jgi:acetate kinase
MKKEKNILVFNVGSSSIKYSLFEGLNLIDIGYYERLKDKEDYRKSIIQIFEKVNKNNLDLIAHRVVHGGGLKKPVKVNEEVKSIIEIFSEFAPLHNPKQLMVIDFCEKYKKPQYAFFDTAFFSDIPKVAQVYAIPKELSKKFQIRRYGFHGLSHECVSRNLKGKLITCHLGSGASISAILDGKPLDTSMGFTPLEGLIMGTRSGTIDPGIILFLEKKKYSVEKILTEKSGLKGICKFNDFRDILRNLDKKDCKLAYDMFIYSIIKIIGSYVGVLNGLDNLVFTGAIGENVARLREEVCDNFKFLGLKLNKKRNKTNEELISSENSKVKVFVKKTNEERIIIEEILKVL